MRKAVITLASIIIAISLVMGGWLTYVIMNQDPGPPPLGIADRTININVMLNRPDNWKKLDLKPVITVEEMAVIDGSTATIPITAELFRQFFDYSDEDINHCETVLHSTTHNAYLNLIDREYRAFGHDSSGNVYDGILPVSLIFVTAPSIEERDYAASKKVELDITAIAKDGFVFITHKNSPIDSLTVAQIQDIYSGKITNWAELGGENLEIRAYQREENSGSQTAMIEMVMRDKEMTRPIIVSAKDDIYYGMGPLVEAVAEFENGPASIGYSFYYYINNLYKNENIKVIKIDGIEPSNENLVNEIYPFTTNYYAIMRKDKSIYSPARKLRDFLISDDGQRLIELAGYCKVVK